MPVIGNIRDKVVNSVCTKYGDEIEQHIKTMTGLDTYALTQERDSAAHHIQALGANNEVIYEFLLYGDGPDEVELCGIVDGAVCHTGPHVRLLGSGKPFEAPYTRHPLAGEFYTYTDPRGRTYIGKDGAEPMQLPLIAVRDVQDFIEHFLS